MTKSDRGDGPLTKLVEHQTGQSRTSSESDLPQPNPPERQGPEDYASGTPEHEDDR